MRLFLRFTALAVLALAVVCGNLASPLPHNIARLEMLNDRSMPGVTLEEVQKRMSPGSEHSSERHSPPPEQHRKGKGKGIIGKLKRLTLGKKDKGKGVSTSYSQQGSEASPVREASHASTTPPESPWKTPFIRSPDTPAASPPLPVGPFPGDYHGPPQSKGKKMWKTVQKFF